MTIFEELSWPEFKNLNHIRPLPLNEQVNHYNSYLNELARNRYLYEQWLANQNKGPKPLTLAGGNGELGVLLQEDLFHLEQEDGSKIYITGYA